MQKQHTLRKLSAVLNELPSMTTRWIHAAILCALALALQLLLRGDYAHLPLPQYFPDDYESLLARGEQLPFYQIGMAELELIPGISDTLAGRLVEAKRPIYLATAVLPADQYWRALEVVRGIGPRTARGLSQYLDLTPPQGGARSFVPLIAPHLPQVSDQ